MLRMKFGENYKCIFGEKIVTLSLIRKELRIFDFLNYFYRAIISAACYSVAVIRGFFIQLSANCSQQQPENCKESFQCLILHIGKPFYVIS